MKQREIINILNKINENKINNIVFCDDSKVLDNMNGYRNDRGVWLLVPKRKENFKYKKICICDNCGYTKKN